MIVIDVLTILDLDLFEMFGVLAEVNVLAQL